MNRILLVITLSVSLSSFGQQIPIYNHYFLNPFVFNPAMVGESGSINSFIVRNARNSSFGGGAGNNYFTVEGPVSLGKFGLGLSVVNQNIGLFRQLGASGSYAYRLELGTNQNLRFGVQAGFLDNNIDDKAINVLHEDDPFLLQAAQNKIAFNATVGVSYNWKNLKAGIVVPQIIGNKVNYGDGGNRAFYRLERHFMGSVENRFNISGSWGIVPSAIVRYMPNSPIQYDGILRVDNKDLGWIGVGYKSDYALEFNIGVRLFDALSLGFSYEYVNGDMRGYTSGMNYEVALGYSFRGNAKEKRRIAELEEENDGLNDAVIDLQNQLANASQVDKDQFEELQSRIIILEDSLNKLNNLYSFLEIERDKLKEELAALREAMQHPTPADAIDDNEVKQEKIDEDNEIIRSEGYYFKDLENNDAPAGYYVINGVFSSRSNAMNQLQKIHNKGYEDAYLLINWTNKFYYAIIHHTEDRNDALKTRRKFVRKNKQKTWVLEYFGKY